MEDLTPEQIRQLRQEAIGRLTIVWDEYHPEATVLWDAGEGRTGTPLVMIRSLTFGAEDPDGFPDDDWSLSGYGAQGRFKLFAWDNDDTNGEFTEALWESSLTWPPPDPDEEAVEGLRTIIDELEKHT